MILIVMIAIAILNVYYMLNIYKDRLFFVLQTIFLIFFLPGLVPNPHAILVGIILGIIFIYIRYQTIPPKAATVNIFERLKMMGTETKHYPEFIQMFIFATTILNVLMIGMAIFAIWIKTV